MNITLAHVFLLGWARACACMCRRAPPIFELCNRFSTQLFALTATVYLIQITFYCSWVQTSLYTKFSLHKYNNNNCIEHCSMVNKIEKYFGSPRALGKLLFFIRIQLSRIGEINENGGEMERPLWRVSLLGSSIGPAFFITVVPERSKEEKRIEGSWVAIFGGPMGSFIAVNSQLCWKGESRRHRRNSQ